MRRLVEFLMQGFEIMVEPLVGGARTQQETCKRENYKRGLRQLDPHNNLLTFASSLLPFPVVSVVPAPAIIVLVVIVLVVVGLVLVTQLLVGRAVLLLKRPVERAVLPLSHRVLVGSLVLRVELFV